MSLASGVAKSVLKWLQNTAAARPRVSIIYIATTIAYSSIISTYLTYIHKYSFNWGQIDDFILVYWYHQAIILNKTPFIHLFTLYDNSHLLSAQAFVSWLIFYAFGINFKILIYASAALLYLGSVLLTVLLCSGQATSSGRSLALLVLLVMMFHPVQAHALLWAFEIGWFMVTFALVANVFIIERYAQAGLRWIVVICVVATFSSAQGLLLWLAAMLQIALFPELRRRRLWLGILFLGFCLGAVAISTITHPEPGGIREGAMRFSDIVQIADYVIGLLGSIFGGWPLDVVRALGIAVLIVIAGWGWIHRSRDLQPNERSGFVLIAASLMFAAAFSLGRFRLGLPWALWDNHAGPLLAPAVCGLSMLAIEGIGKRTASGPAGVWLGCATLAFSLASIIPSARQAILIGEESRMERVLAVYLSCKPDTPWGAVLRANGLTTMPFVVEEALPLVRPLCAGEEAKAAHVFAAASEQFSAMAAAHPDYAKPLADLWSVYLIRPDVRRAFPADSEDLLKLLLSWAQGDALQAASSEPLLLGPHKAFFLQLDPNSLP